MKKVKYSLLVSLVLGTLAMADTNSTDVNDTLGSPPLPDYSLIIDDEECDQEYLNKVLAIAIENAKKEQIEMCKNNPSACGISVVSTPDVTEQNSTMLSAGWHLLGASVDINITENAPSDIKIVWRYENLGATSGRWLAYSPNPNIQSEIEEMNETIGTFTNIPAYSGFWIFKEWSYSGYATD